MTMTMTMTITMTITMTMLPASKSLTYDPDLDSEPGPGPGLALAQGLPQGLPQGLALALVQGLALAQGLQQASERALAPSVPTLKQNGCPCLLRGDCKRKKTSGHLRRSLTTFDERWRLQQGGLHHPSRVMNTLVAPSLVPLIPQPAPGISVVDIAAAVVLSTAAVRGYLLQLKWRGIITDPTATSGGSCTAGTAAGTAGSLRGLLQPAATTGQLPQATT